MSLEKLLNLTGDIEFTSRIPYNKITYIEPKMRATIEEIIEISAGVLRVKFDFRKFDEFNKQFEKNNYYDKHKIARLTAREAGWYDPVNYFEMTEAELRVAIVVLDEKRRRLWTSFEKSEYTSYILFLESFFKEANV
jgi:hypothetical protein